MSAGRSRADRRASSRNHSARDFPSRSTAFSTSCSSSGLSRVATVLARRPGRAVSVGEDGRNAGSAHSMPTSKRAGIHAIHASSAASSTESNNHNRISVFTRSSAEDDILFTNVNVEIHKNNLVADSESVDAPKSPDSFRYPCSSRLGVTCHPSAAAKQRFSKPKPKPNLSGHPPTNYQAPFSIGTWLSRNWRNSIGSSGAGANL